MFMNVKLRHILILLIFFILSLILTLNSARMHEYRVLKVVEADKLYIDINSNGSIDEYELVQIKDIIAYSPYKINKDSQTEKITHKENLINGYIAQNWAKDNVENKLVKARNLKKCKLKKRNLSC